MAKRALRRPDIKPGMPCKLLTPQVSCNLILFKSGVRYSYPITERTPENEPIRRAPYG